MNLIEAQAWANEMDINVTVCDIAGKIVYMNNAARLNFHKWGGSDLIGKSLLDCHNSRSRETIKEMLELPYVNIYGREKKEVKNIIRQFPWMEDGQHKGIIEISFDLPSDFEFKKSKS